MVLLKYEVRPTYKAELPSLSSLCSSWHQSCWERLISEFRQVGAGPRGRPEQ